MIRTQLFAFSDFIYNLAFIFSLLVVLDYRHECLLSAFGINSYPTLWLCKSICMLIYLGNSWNHSPCKSSKSSWIQHLLAFFLSTIMKHYVCIRLDSFRIRLLGINLSSRSNICISYIRGIWKFVIFFFRLPFENDFC